MGTLPKHFYIFLSAGIVPSEYLTVLFAMYSEQLVTATLFHDFETLYHAVVMSNVSYLLYYVSLSKH